MELKHFKTFQAEVNQHNKGVLCKISIENIDSCSRLGETYPIRTTKYPKMASQQMETGNGYYQE